MAEPAGETFQEGGTKTEEEQFFNQEGGENFQQDGGTKEELPLEDKSPMLIGVVIAGFVFALVAILYLYREKEKRKKKDQGRRLDRRAVRGAVLETDIPSFDNPKRFTIIGREPAFKVLLGAMSNDFSRTLVTGPPGIGKATLLDNLSSSKDEILQAIANAQKAGAAKTPLNTLAVVRATSEFQLKKDLFGVAVNIGSRAFRMELVKVEERLRDESGNKGALEKRRGELLMVLNELSRLVQSGFDEQQLNRFLPDLAKFSDWMLLIVGVEDPSILQPLNFLKSGRIIVSSSLKLEDFSPFFQFNGVFELPPLESKDCISLFDAQNSTLGGVAKLPEGAREDLVGIFDSMGRLPLAVKILAQVSETCIPANELIEVVKTRKLDMNGLIDYVYNEILLLNIPAFATAKKLLEYLSFLSPYGVPELLFRQDESFLTKVEEQAPADIFEGFDKYARIEAFSDETFEISSRILQNLGLILIVDIPLPEDKKYRAILTHSAIQARVRKFVANRENKAFVLRPLVHLMTKNFSENLYQDKIPWPLLSSIAANVTELVKHLDGIDRATLLRSLGTFARQIQGFERAEKLLLESKTIFRAMTDQDSADIALIDNVLASSYSESGDFGKAISSARTSLDVWRRMGHAPNVIQTLLLLARTYEGSKNLPEAFKALEETLSILELKNGKDSEKLLPVLDQIANLKIRNGKSGEAVPYLERALEIAKGEFGEEAPQIFSRYHKLSLALEAANDLPAALSFAEVALKIHEKMKEKTPDHTKDRAVLVDRVVKLSQNIKALQQKIEELEAKKGKDSATKLKKSDLKKALHG